MLSATAPASFSRGGRRRAQGERQRTRGGPCRPLRTPTTWPTQADRTRHPRQSRGIQAEYYKFMMNGLMTQLNRIRTRQRRGRGPHAKPPANSQMGAQTWQKQGKGGKDVSGARTQGVAKHTSESTTTRHSANSSGSCSARCSASRARG